MPKPKLSTQQKTILRRSNKNAVQAVLGRLALHIRRGRWLGNNNTYRLNCIRVLEKKWRGHLRPINHRHLSEYIIASAPLHCTDGWSFLGRALDCHAQGDSDAARHLAYYAELRGAMSLLAAEGIGIFYRRHFVLGSPLRCLEFKRGGTHEGAWLALEHWAGLRRSADLLANVIEPAGIRLADWLEAFPGASTTWRPIGAEWLKSWGLDLRRLSDDREARNEASYRPTCVNARALLDVLDSSSFMHSLWVVCEPSAPSRFELLDRHLLRLSLEQAFEAVTGKKAKDDPSDFGSRVATMLYRVAPSGLPTDEWRRFLARDVQAEDSVLTTEARGTVAVRDPRHHIQVMARAALLLRVATGACALLLREAGFGRSELEFWWKNLGEERGLWEPGDEPDELLNLWADVDMALGDMHQWEISNSGTNASYARWHREQLYAISVLGECERIVLWGLGL
jgi:hypothetical protein